MCDGAVRAGKTSVMSTAVFDWAMREFNHCNFAICGRTVGSAIKNIIKPYMAMSYAKQRYTLKFNRSENLLTVKRGNVENYFYVYGGKDESSYTLIQGITLAGLFIDEVTLLVRSFVEQALARCSVENSKIWFNCNTASPSHWFYTDWILQAKEKNALRLHFLMTDNPSLSEKKLAEYNNRFTGVFHDRYILGLWVVAEGVIYTEYADNEEKFLYDEEKLNLNDIILISIGIDYGASKAKSCFKATGFTRGYKKVYIMEEHEIFNTANPENLYKEFHKFFDMMKAKYNRVHYGFADWGGLGEVITNGLVTYCMRNALPIDIQDCQKGRIIDRIQLTTSLMAQGRLFVNKRCRYMRQAFRDAVWSDKAEDERLDDGSTDIDSLDSFEYAIYPFREQLNNSRRK